MSIDEQLTLLESGQSLSELDNEVISIIHKACDSFGTRKIYARIVGGWVRDHLLGVDNDDIDVAVEGISCHEFGERILTFDRSFSIAHMNANPREDVSIQIVRIGISKDKWFDITDYGENGTAMDDAMRRDFTVNAIFFNITTMKVEDLVGGLDDMKKCVLRMPIDPVQSILEDPRRVLRCFRFAAKLSYEVDEGILEAIRNNVDNFDKNISNGRIGLEISKMFDSKNISISIDLIVKTNMFGSIFDPQKTCKMDSYAAAERVRRLIPVLCDKDQLVLLMAAIYYPIYNPNPNAPTLQAVLKKLYLPNDVGFAAKKIQRAAYEISHKMELNRTSVGKLIRDLGERWFHVEYMLNEGEELDFFKNQFIPFVEKEDLSLAWQIKPLMSGTEISLLHGVSPGKTTGKLLESMINWQLDNPGCSKEDYVAFIRPQH